jgi:MtN3 and saliva related transmembrane protein
MNYLEISRILTVVGGIAITVGLYAQSIKIFKTKSAKDFSWIILFALMINELVWLNYGFALSEWPIILLSGANIPGVVLTVIGFLLYRHKGGEDRVRASITGRKTNTSRKT